MRGIIIIIMIIIMIIIIMSKSHVLMITEVKKTIKTHGVRDNKNGKSKMVLFYLMYKD